MPRLITHRPQTQVIQCDYVDPSGRAKDSCILKLFSPRARIAYEKEVSAYSLLQAQQVEATASTIWNGIWTANQYQVTLRRQASVNVTPTGKSK